MRHAVAFGGASRHILQTGWRVVLRKKLSRVRNPGSRGGRAAIVATDKTHYEPGEAVTFSGRGFQPGETIDLLIHQTHPGGAVDRGGSLLADESGAFVNSDFFLAEEDRNTTLSVTATGQSSGISVGSSFSDPPAFIVGHKVINQTTDATVPDLTATYSSAPAVGNLLVAHVYAFGNGTTINAPSGWSTAIFQAGLAGSPAGGIFYKISVGAADTSVTATFTPNTTGTITISEYSGVISSSDPFDGGARVTGNTTNLSVPR